MKKYVIHNTDFGVEKETDNVESVNNICFMWDNKCWVEVIDDRTESEERDSLKIADIEVLQSVIDEDDCFNLPDDLYEPHSEWEEFETWRDDGNQFWGAIISVIIFIISFVGVACIVEIICRYIW